jgi:hypothetical protein
MHAALTVLAILFGWLFTVATAWALGTLLIRKLSLPFYHWEERLFAFLVGAALLSAIVFVLCAANLAWKALFLVLGLAIILYALHSGAHRPRGESFPPLPRLWRYVFLVVFGAFTFLYFFNALAPESSPDGMSYHLGVVAKYQRTHGFPRITTDIYASLSEGIELLFLWAFEYGRHSAAALVHFAFFLALTFLILSYARRIGRPAVGVAAAIFFYASPVVGLDGSVAYIDVGITAVLFGLFYLLQIWDHDRNAKFLIPIGILAGFSYAVKYTAFVAVPYTLGFIAWKLWRTRKPLLRPVLVVSLLALAFMLPWMAKSWIEVANPFSPFANRVFANPYVHISFEETYRKYMQVYALTSYWQIPWQVTVRGDLTTGLIGPLFLLSPLALLALRFREGRQLLLAGLIFGLPYLTNVGTRFLIPAIPFIALSLALALSGLEWLLLVLVAAHAISCWPNIVQRYCSPAAWRLVKVSPKAALRIQPQDAYLKGNLGYDLAQMMESFVPMDAKVFAFTQPGTAYTSRQVLVGYEGAFNELLQDILWTPMFRDFQPTRILTFRFAPRELRKIRVVQTASVPAEAQWSVSELRVFDNGRDLPRDPEWRLTGHPNPWDIQLAFDNSAVTRWRSWQPPEPGMYLEIDFPRNQKLDSVVVESSGDSSAAKIKLDGLAGDGKWTALAANPTESLRANRMSLRQAATAELKARGVRYLLITDDNVGANDFRSYSKLWGLKTVAEQGTARLYYIE